MREFGPGALIVAVGGWLASCSKAVKSGTAASGSQDLFALGKAQGTLTVCRSTQTAGFTDVMRSFAVTKSGGDKRMLQILNVCVKPSEKGPDRRALGQGRHPAHHGYPQVTEKRCITVCRGRPNGRSSRAAILKEGAKQMRATGRTVGMAFQPISNLDHSADRGCRA